MNKIAAYLPAWGFFWLGHLISLLMNWSDHFVFLYPVYSTLMCWSLFFNDWGKLNVWLDKNE